jgi:uncharacterized protein
MATTFHAGEIAIQQQAGTYQGANRLGNGIRNVIPENFAAFMADQVIAVAASVDRDGNPWASALVGTPGYLQVLDPRNIAIQALPISGDPLESTLQEGGNLGLLVIDFANRGRIRLNGKASLHEAGIRLRTEEVFGNCPKYIQQRSWLPAPPVTPVDSQRNQSMVLTPHQQAWIAAADTFFVASANPVGGADASHRGGQPGFVVMLDAQTLVWPDYAGNGMFQTLGNFALYPHAGLLFIDFERGSLLQLSGTTEISWDAQQLARYPGAERVVQLHIEHVIETNSVLPFRFQLQSYSRFNPHIERPA